MLRRTTLILSLSLLVGSSLFAQSDPKVNFRETPAMVKVAKERTAALNKQLKLTSEQREQVQQVFLHREKMMDALQQRYRLANASPETWETDKVSLVASMEKQEKESLATLLTPEQFARYEAMRPQAEQ